MVKLFAYSMAIASFVTGSLRAGLIINEIRTDQDGADNDEYFEVYADGMSFSDLSNFSYIVIGDGAGSDGTIENVYTFPSVSLNAGEFFLVAESTFTLAIADATASLNFENEDNVTHLLVQDFTGSNGSDLDTDDDGTLDSTPWSSISDEIALVDSITSGELIYSSTTIGPNGSTAPAHVFRNIDGASGSFVIGSFNSLASDTPGASNSAVQVPEPSAFVLLALVSVAMKAMNLRRDN